jgi:hypothetical protein
MQNEKGGCMNVIVTILVMAVVSSQCMANELILSSEMQKKNVENLLAPKAHFGANSSYQNGFDLVLEMDKSSCQEIYRFKPFSRIISNGNCLKKINVVRLRDFFPRPPVDIDKAID